MKKMLIGKKLYDVVDIETYTNNTKLYDDKFTAIECGNTVLPIKGKNDLGPGIIYNEGSMVHKLDLPDDSNKHNYDSSNIIDYSKAETMQDLICKENLVRDIEKDILINKDNILSLKIGKDDTPQMVGMKQSINAKEVDPKQYERRIPQYQNDMRLLKGKDITMSKAISLANAFDIEIEMIYRDKKGCVNPMNKEIRVILTTEDSAEGDE